MSQQTGKKSSSKSKKVITDDEFLDQCIKNNETCSHSTCNKSIKVIKLHCKLCNEFFCTSHVLPEIHGCGKAAKKSASASAYAKKELTDSEKQLLEKKMSQKLSKMQGERKKKTK